MNKKHIGSDFDDFLKEEKILKKARTTAIKRLSVKLNAKNQITLPRHIRERLNISAGALLRLDVQDGVLVLIPLLHSKEDDPIKKGYGFLKGGSSMADDLKLDRELEKQRDKRLAGNST